MALHADATATVVVTAFRGPKPRANDQPFADDRDLPSATEDPEIGDVLWVQHGWALGAHHVALVILVILLAAVLGTLSHGVGLT